MNNRKDLYTKEQKELLGTIIKLVLKKKLDKKEIEKLVNKLKEEKGDMLAVLEMIEEENKRLLKRGIKKGEKQKTIEIARNMLAKNMPLELIQEMVGLSETEIVKLKSVK